MAALAPEEQQAFLTKFPSMYTNSSDVVRLQIQKGQIDLTSLNSKGFATECQKSQIDWAQMALVY
jgi:hypothetical protein